jgi:hypothetical protein
MKIKDTLLIFKDMVIDFFRSEHSYLLGFIIAFGVGFLFELAGWWYLMVLAGGIAGFVVKKNGLICFVIGFLAIAALWACFFVYFMIIGPLSELTALITTILGFLEATPGVLILITIIIGGLLGGLGALNGTFIAGIVFSGEKPDETGKEKDIKPPKN